MLMLYSIDMNILSIEDKHIHMEFLLEINNYLFQLFEKLIKIIPCTCIVIRSCTSPPSLIAIQTNIEPSSDF